MPRATIVYSRYKLVGVLRDGEVMDQERAVGGQSILEAVEAFQLRFEPTSH